jgi:hypothetical protein
MLVPRADCSIINLLGVPGGFYSTGANQTGGTDNSWQVECTSGSSTMCTNDVNFSSAFLGVGANAAEAAEWGVPVGFPFSPVPAAYYYNNLTGANWIAPAADLEGMSFGNYSVWDYETSFNIPSTDIASTASFSGIWNADNYALAILLNGHVIWQAPSNLAPNGATPCNGVTNPTCTGYNADDFSGPWVGTTDPYPNGISFGITQGGSGSQYFQSGLNNLVFIVQNAPDVPTGPNPSALDVSFTNATVDSMPEPATIGLLALGLAGLAIFRRKSRQV